MFGIGPDHLVKWAILGAGLFAGFKLLQHELPAIERRLGAGHPANPAQGLLLGGGSSIAITGGTGLNYVLPQPGHGPPTDALLNCHAGSYVTYAGDIKTIDDIRAQLIGMRVLNAASMSTADLLTNWNALVGPILPC